MFLSIYVVLIFLISTYHCKLPEKVLCANDECNKPISKAITLVTYSSPEPEFISYKAKSDALIFMKSVEYKPEIWFARINGQNGLVNPRFLKELKILEKTPKIVPTVDVISKKQDVQPDRVQKAHEVFEGTTIFTTESSSSLKTEHSDDLPVNDQNKSPPAGVEKIESILNQKKIETVVTSDQLYKDDTSINVNTLPTVEKKLPDTSVNNDQSVGNYKKAMNDSENVSMEINTEPEERSFIDNLSKSPSNDLNDQTLELKTNNDNNLNMLPTEPPIVNVNEVNANNMINSEAKMQSEVDNINISNTNEDDKPEQGSNIEENHPKISENTPAEVSAENIVPPSEINEINPNNIQTIPETIPVATVPHVPELTENNTLISNNILANTELLQNTNILPENSLSNEPVPIEVPPMSEPKPLVTESPIDNPKVPDNIVETVTSVPEVSPMSEPKPLVTESPIDNPKVPDNVVETVTSVPEVSPMSVPKPLVTESPIDNPKVPDNIVETVTSVPELTNTIPVQFDNIGPSIPPIENNPPETIPTIPEILLAQPVISVPDYSSENHLISQYTTETIAAIETSTESYISNEDTKTIESDTPTAILEKMPSSSDSSDLSSHSTENLINEIFTESTTQSPVQDTSEGFFSNIYTTITDMKPPSTEQPPPDNIFNPDYVQKTENEPEETESFSIINYLWATYTSVMGAKDESSALFPVVGETCYTDEYCDGTGNNHNRFLTFLLTTASTILLFTLGYYYIDNKRQDSRLIGNINNLQRELLFATKECEILKEELTTTKTKLAGIEDNSFGMDDMVQSLKEEINDLKEQNERLRNSLDDNEKLLRVSENTASELQNTLGEVENTLSELMEERTNSEEQITELNEKIRAFEEELIIVSRDRDNFQLKYVSTEKDLEEFKKQKQVLEELNKKIIEANNTIELQKHEIVALKDTIKELKNGSSSNVDVNSLIDHTEIKAKLAKALEEKNSYMSKYELAHKEQARLAEELKATQESYQTTSQQATEAVTRLEVLGKYFQERESELMKELSTKESLYLSKRGESASTVEKMELLQQEIQRYKEKCDALTLSLAEQESAKRATVSELEARAHQAWLEARAARRDADAVAADAAALRRKLVAVSHADGAVSPHRQVASPLETEGAPVPPLPLTFFPPPLLPPLARPPPLGRLPSPPLLPRFGERRYSPESRYSPETRYSPESRYSPQSRYSPDRARYPPESRYSPRRRSPYSSRSRRSIDRYSERGSRRNGDTETEYNSDSPSRRPRRRYSRRSDSSGSGCSSESEK